MTVGPKFPVEPLMRLAGVDTMSTLDELVGVAHSSARRAMKRGGLGLVAADRWATRLGLHPANCWPDWYIETARDAA